MIYWQIPPQARETAKVVDLNSHQCINGAANMNNIKAKLKLSIGATAKLEVLLILTIGNLMLLISFCCNIFKLFI